MMTELTRVGSLAGLAERVRGDDLLKVGTASTDSKAP